MKVDLTKPFIWIGQCGFYSSDSCKTVGDVLRKLAALSSLIFEEASSTCRFICLSLAVCQCGITDSSTHSSC